MEEKHTMYPTTGIIKFTVPSLDVRAQHNLSLCQSCIIIFHFLAEAVHFNQSNQNEILNLTIKFNHASLSYLSYHPHLFLFLKTAHCFSCSILLNIE